MIVFKLRNKPYDYLCNLKNIVNSASNLVHNPYRSCALCFNSCICYTGWSKSLCAPGDYNTERYK